MKAAYIEEAGGPEKIKIGELPKPDPGSDGVLVRNQAAAVGPWDWKMLLGGWGKPLEFPYIPGFEAAGVVEQAPEGSGFKLMATKPYSSTHFSSSGMQVFGSTPGD